MDPISPEDQPTEPRRPTHADMDSSAVSILVDLDTHPHKPLGTGFYFLQRHYFVTAKHVVEHRDTGAVRSNLVLMQNGPDYPKAEVVFRHPSLDLAVLKIDKPACKTPLYPSDQHLAAQDGLRYWGYAPSLSHPDRSLYAVFVGGPAEYVDEPARERNDGTERLLRFEGLPYEPGHSGGPVIGTWGGVVGVIIEGDNKEGGWFRATEISALLPFVSFTFPMPDAERVPEMLSQAKELARDYYTLTGRPLGVTGEIAEYEAMRLMGLELAAVRTAGYDAIRPSDGRRFQIKGRRLAPTANPGQRIGKIDVSKDFDAVLLVLLDQAFNALAIYEADRDAVIAALSVPGSRARNERGALGVTKFKQIGRRVWARAGAEAP